ncbi:OmpA family protein [Zeaxanthinibacter sp. PT1]|uniref:OmpA family protein n=1 Tax=Zeaxanthinibacter TaxID=561554 RepID=UPI0023493368|nr:OmpA family protein [Zeaxanthinibacter sp. PT1]MDC6351298.1 OmpA family protein [Zeaxanthinibacter sp. PT1]
MKIRSQYPVLALLLMVFLCVPRLEAQLLKKLGKKAERAAERTIERRVERETEKKTDAALDSILEPGSKTTPTGPEPGNPEIIAPSGNDQNKLPESGSTPETIQVYSKFDYVPGDQPIFYDDFGNDFIGDFPSKWNTNGGGEVVSINQNNEKWFSMIPGYNTYYIPDVPALPDEYTIEFDVLATGLDRQTSSSAKFRVILSNTPGFKNGKDITVDIPFCQYHPVGFHVRNHADINNNIQADIRNKVIAQPHVSIAVNQQRFRLWVDESKYVDIPRMISLENRPSTLKFELLHFKDGKERLFIKNLKVAEGGLDLRKKLIADGSVSTNGIIFDSGSAEIKPQSMGIIRQISQVLQQENDMKLLIVGHTDADGSDETNLQLSADRAASVRDALVTIYNIDAGRLTTEGKGEKEPIADNTTTEGKSKNRRVEFIKT